MTNTKYLNLNVTNVQNFQCRQTAGTRVNCTCSPCISKPTEAEKGQLEYLLNSQYLSKFSISKSENMSGNFHFKILISKSSFQNLHFMVCIAVTWKGSDKLPMTLIIPNNKMTLHNPNDSSIPQMTPKPLKPNRCERRGRLKLTLE